MRSLLIVGQMRPETPPSGRQLIFPFQTESHYRRADEFWGGNNVGRSIIASPVSHDDGDGLHNVRSNLVVATRSVSAARAVNVLKRGNFKPAGQPIENKVRKVLADGTTRIYVYDRRTRRLLRSWNENPLATKSANRMQTVPRPKTIRKRKSKA
jgi:hypothetical protein